jgi:predicted GIY-YIG superfamily endonuclease
MTVYILHFETKLHHAQHYLGFARDLDVRLMQHANGTGARLLKAVGEAGISWRVARTWDGGWGLERYLKRQKNGPRLCPICQRKRN